MALGDIKSQIIATAQSQGVPPNLALAVAQHESSYNPNAVGPVNKNGTQDYGLFQINDSNFSSLGITDPLDPTQNINAGVGMLKDLLNRYGGDYSKVLAAYNEGPTAVAKGAQDPAYVSAVMGIYNSLGGDNSYTASDTSSSTDTSEAGVIDGGGLAALIVGGILVWLIADKL